MAVRVDEVRLAKSQKCFNVTLSGQKFLGNLDCGLNANVGKWIEAEIKPSNDTRFPSWIGKWVHAVDPSSAHAQQGAPATFPVTGGAPGTQAVTQEPRYAEPSDNVQPWWMPFVSNTVAHAIEKGLCTTPEAINQWALKAAQVAVATKEAVRT